MSYQQLPIYYTMPVGSFYPVRYSYTVPVSKRPEDMHGRPNVLINILNQDQNMRPLRGARLGFIDQLHQVHLPTKLNGPPILSRHSCKTILALDPMHP